MTLEFRRGNIRSENSSYVTSTAALMALHDKSDERISLRKSNEMKSNPSIQANIVLPDSL